MSEKKNLDLIISDKVKEIELKELELKELKNPKLYTNCTLKFKDESINLNVKTVNELAVLAGEIYEHLTNYVKGCELIGIPCSPDELKIGNFSANEWIEDIKSVAKKKSTREKELILHKMKEDLKLIYSDEAKRENKLKDILGNLDNI